MQRRPLLYLLLLLFMLLTACTSSQATESQMTTVEKLDLALVERINILNASSGEITLIASGQLPNSCSNIKKTDIEHDDNAITVSIYTTQVANNECETNPINFTEEVKIDLSGFRETSYKIFVNGVSIKAEIPASSISSAVVESTPSPKIDLQKSGLESASNDDEGIVEEESPLETTQATSIATQIAQPTKTVEETEQESTSEVSATETAQEAQTTAAPTESEAVSQECIDKAAFYADVTVPDNTIFKPYDAFKKTWRVRNEGTCTWDDRYSLVFASGEIMNGPLSNSLPVVAPGEVSDISIDLQAPSRWGKYTGNWQFENGSGQRFGVGAGGHDYIWVQIFVDSPAPPPSSNPPTSPQSGSPSGQSTASCPVEQNASYEQQVLSFINNARSSQGLSPLNLQSQLSSAAYVHSSDMACSDFIGHTGSDASSWYDRVSAQGYANYNSARENIYVGDPNFGGTPEGAFNWWMNSQVHRDNILNPNVSDIGIGYVYYTNGSYGGYYTTVFARP